MGALVSLLRSWAKKISNKKPWALRLNGVLLTLIVVSISGLSGWLIERLALPGSPIPIRLGEIILLIALTSAIAAKSLRKSVIEVLFHLPKTSHSNDLDSARAKLSQIVGRDVKSLNIEEILRATAETASENSVDGVFAPLFWMLTGVIFWEFSTDFPGPLTLAWIFKATSTIDSMIGYKRGELIWLGSAGAHLDDFLTWIPCRLVLISLPLISNSWQKFPELTKAAWKDGSKDPSPNSGLSEAIFAYCAGVRMGGLNKYQGIYTKKEILAKNYPSPNNSSIKKILSLSLRLEVFWLVLFLFISKVFFIS